MTSRERFLAILDYKPPDEPLLVAWMGFSGATLARWRGEGLPEGVHPDSFLGLTRVRGLPVSVFPCPEREDILLEEGATYRIVRDNRDLTVRHDTEAPHFPQYLDHPVKSRADWDRYKTRINRGCEERYDQLRATAEEFRCSDLPVVLGLRGCWEIRYFLGMTEALCMLHDGPDFVQEMADFWTEFVAEIMAPILARVQLDDAGISEDIAYKEHSMISPEMVRRFVLPAYRRWVPAIRASGRPLVIMDCDGYVADLLPLWIETGINCCWPVEKAAGNGIVAYRRRCGTQMAYWGGIDKRVLAVGGRAMEMEVMRIVPPLLEQGGFIPQCDHAVPPDVSWPNFVEYARLLAELTGWR